jgi:hypothetical protein
VAWETLKDFIGINDAMACFGGDMWSCVSIAVDAIPWTKLGKIPSVIKAVNRTIKAIESFRAAKKAAELVRKAAKAAEAAALRAKKLAIERAKKLAAQRAKKKAAEAAKRTADRAAAAAKKTGNRVQKQAQSKAAPKVSSHSGGGGKSGGGGSKPGGKSGGSSKSNGGSSGSGGSGKAGCNSFVPGTKVLMADGTTKPIEKVKNGDKVVATDPKTGETRIETVTAEIKGEGLKHLVKITIDVDGSKGTKTAQVTATDGHPFWVPELHAWIKATALKTGQWLQTSAGVYVQIAAIQRWTAPATVHNLTVGDVHTYYVLAAATSLLVHNDSCPTGGEDSVYRGDGRSPDEIESDGGFMPQAPDSDTSLLAYASDINNHSRYVGTSRSRDIAATYFGGREGYVYEIQGAPNGIDVNAELGPMSPSPHEREIAFDGGIPWQYVTRVWKKDEWGEIDFDYDDPIWER